MFDNWGKAEGKYITSVKAYDMVNLTNCCPSPLRTTGGSLTLLKRLSALTGQHPVAIKFSQIQDRVILRKVTEALTHRQSSHFGRLNHLRNPTNEQLGLFSF